ncbi:hypothetical protein ASC97_22080 [Rhizobium sp. Root1203]|nr:hypothetical protein ASC97_22080 [Rhizobium sp. Root1203]
MPDLGSYVLALLDHWGNLLRQRNLRLVGGVSKKRVVRFSMQKIGWNRFSLRRLNEMAAYGQVNALGIAYFPVVLRCR